MRSWPAPLAAGTIVFLVIVFGFHTITATKTVSSPVSLATHQNPPSKIASHGLPVRLKIPVINVDTAIEDMGLTAQGDLAAPIGPDDVGWYKLGPRPGVSGSAVIDGHEGWVNNRPAVFDNLNKLQKGDRLLVIDAQGQTTTFVVQTTRTYGQTQPHGEVFKSSSGTHLNLITCAGDWDKTQQHYLNRLVVFADLAG